MNAIVPTAVNLPAHIAKRMQSPSSLSASISSGIDWNRSLPRISIKASTFRIIEGGTETVIDSRKLNVIIVGANPGVSKTFYASKWTNDDDDKGAPDCHSYDGVRPLADSKNKQADLCATCPNNQWGSKINDAGQKTKLCQDQKRLAVVAANDPGGTVYLLQVSPTALKNLNDYTKLLARNGYPPECVITTLGFDPSVSYPKLTFAFHSFISEEAAEAIDSIFDSETVREVTGEQTQVALVIEEQKPKPVLVQAPPPAPPPPKPVSKAAAKFGATDAPVEKPKAQTKEPEPAPAVVSSKLSDEIAAMLEAKPDDDANDA